MVLARLGMYKRGPRLLDFGPFLRPNASEFPRRTHTGSQISTKGNCRKLSESTRYAESVGLAIAYVVRERINVPIIATAGTAASGLSRPLRGPYTYIYTYIRERSQSYARFHRSKCCSLPDNHEEGVRRARKSPEKKKECIS